MGQGHEAGDAIDVYVVVVKKSGCEPFSLCAYTDKDAAIERVRRYQNLPGYDAWHETVTLHDKPQRHDIECNHAYICMGVHT